MAGPGGIEAGRASVLTLPNLTKFAGSLKKYLERVERTVRLELPVSADTSRLGEEIDRTRTEQEKRPIDVPLQAKADEFTRRVRQAVAKARAGVEADIPVTADGERFRRELEEKVAALEGDLRVDVPMSPEAAAIFRRKVLDQVEEIQVHARNVPVEVPVQPAGMSGFVTKLRAYVREAEATAPTINIKTDVDRSRSAAISSLLGVIGNVQSVALTVGKALATWGPPIVAALAAAVALAPAFALAVPLIAGIGAGVGVVAYSMSRLQKQFKPVAKALGELQKPVAEAFTNGLAPIAQRIATNLIPALKTGMVGLAQVMNGMVKGVLNFTSSSAGISLITRLLEGMKSALAPLTPSFGLLTKALLQIGVAALPGLTAFSRGLAGVISKFAAFIDAGAKSGSLSENISKAVSGAGALLSGLGNFLGPLSKGLMAIGPSVLTGLGAAFTATGQAITAIIGKARELSPTFAIIKAQLAPLGGLFTAVMAVVKQQFTFFVQTIHYLAPSLQPFVTLLRVVAATIASNIGPAFAFLRTALQPVIAGFKQFLDAVGPQLLPTFMAVKSVIAALVPTVKQFATQFTAVLGPGIAQIGQVIAQDLLPAFRSILPVVTPVLKFLLKILGSSIVLALKGAINIIKGLLKVISGIFNVFAGIFTGDWSKAWNGVKQIFSGAFSALKGAGRPTVSTPVDATGARPAGGRRRRQDARGSGSTAATLGAR